MRSWDEAKYPISFAAKQIWRVPAPTAKLYVDRYLNLSPHDRKAHKAGATTLLTGRRVLQGAIGAALAPSFRNAGLACLAAKAFTDEAHGQEAPGHNRDIGELFAGSLTALAAYPNGQGLVFRVSGAKLSDVLFPRDDAPKGHATVLLLDPIFNRVEIALDKFDADEA